MTASESFKFLLLPQINETHHWIELRLIDNAISSKQNLDQVIDQVMVGGGGGEGGISTPMQTCYFKRGSKTNTVGNN